MEHVLSRLSNTLYYLGLIFFALVLIDAVLKVSKMPGSIFKDKKKEKIIVIVVVAIMGISLLF